MCVWLTSQVAEGNLDHESERNKLSEADNAGRVADK